MVVYCNSIGDNCVFQVKNLLTFLDLKNTISTNTIRVDHNIFNYQSWWTYSRITVIVVLELESLLQIIFSVSRGSKRWG